MCGLKNRGCLRLDQARDKWLHEISVEDCS